MHAIVEILIMLILNPNGKSLEFDFLYKSAEHTVWLCYIDMHYLFNVRWAQIACK